MLQRLRSYSTQCCPGPRSSCDCSCSSRGCSGLCSMPCGGSSEGTNIASTAPHSGQCAGGTSEPSTNPQIVHFQVFILISSCNARATCDIARPHEDAEELRPRHQRPAPRSARYLPLR